MKTLNTYFAILFLSVFGVQGLTHSAYGAPDKKQNANQKEAKKTDSASGNPMALLPEVLGAKAFLEDLLVRRYAQELATSVDRHAFSLGAQLELVEVPPQNDKKDPDDDIPSDLLLGTLDPEDLMRKYAGSEGVLQSQVFLKNYRIASVNLSVGLSENLNPEVKTQVERWLKDRLNAEFGKAGKGSVSLIKVPVDRKPAPEPKSFLDWLNQFQNFAGQLVLALALLFGVLLWKLIASKDKLDQQMKRDEGDGAPSGFASVPAPSLENKSDEKGDPQDQVVAKEDSERLHTLKEIRKFSRQITELNPKFTSYCEQVLRTWCASGEEGQLKLACFAEAVGKDMGKLPIPVDALTDLSKVFVKMPELGIKEKLGFLRKIYWDVLTVINLGPEALEIPFGYLSNMSTGMVNQVLLDENPKMKALVSLYMPSSLRESYLQSLDKEMKRTLLDAAAQMTEIPTDEFRSMDVAVKGKLKPQDNKGTIPLNMGLSKLVSALSPLEEIAILPTMTGPAFDNLKRTLPSIAFLPQWPDDKVSLLVSRAMPDELVAYFRSCPEVADRFIGLAPQMTAELAKDELGRPDTMAEKDKIRLLTELGNRIKELIQSKEVDLEQIFPASAPNAGGQVVGSIGKASEGSDGTQNAA